MVTIFKNIYSDDPFYTTVAHALERIRSGRSKQRVEEIRATLDKERADVLKRQLPSVCFSGKFSRRTDDGLLEHSGFMVLDFDNVESVEEKMASLADHPFVHAAWISPRGNGIKALIRIADGEKHREHFEAVRELFPDADRSGINVSRVCYESYDPDMYLNERATVFTKLKIVDRVQDRESLKEDREVFTRLLKWLSNRNDAFVTGERNLFIFKLASACCRFGIGEEMALGLILGEFPASNDFTHKECSKAIKSAYRANKGLYSSAVFDRDVLVERTTRREVQIDTALFDESSRPKDVVYGEDVKGPALSLYRKGYASVAGVGVNALDIFFKLKRTEITCLTGIGNYGKSTFFKWFILMRVLQYGEKFATFSPEDNPPEEYYHDFVEMLLGCDCTPKNPERPSEEVYSNAYDFISRHIFYVYPKELSPTPEYIKERFLELIVKEKIDGCAVDPFNQMANDYSKSGGRSDKYLETVLSDFSRFAQGNNVYMVIIAHPHKLKKEPNGNYPCPDVFDLADGAMWNNKMDNIIVYHRPFMQTDPENPAVEFHSKKIRRQKTVGKKGFTEFEFRRRTRRYEFDGVDPMAKLIARMDLTFRPKQQEFSYDPVDINF